MQKYTTANPYESQFGYSRATRRGPFIFISGTTSIDSNTGVLLHPDSAYQQALVIFGTLIESVQALGGNKDDITRVRMFVSKDKDSDDVGKALKESLGDVGPAATMIIGAKFVHGDMKVEIEADAVLWEGSQKEVFK